MPKTKTIKLKLGDFKREGFPGSFRHYFSWKNDEIVAQFTKTDPNFVKSIIAGIRNFLILK